MIWSIEIERNQIMTVPVYRIQKVALPIGAAAAAAAGRPAVPEGSG